MRLSRLTSTGARTLWSLGIISFCLSCGDAHRPQQLKRRADSNQSSIATAEDQTTDPASANASGDSFPECAAGFYCSKENRSKPEPCPAGYFCPQGTEDYTENLCNAGRYCAESSSVAAGTGECEPGYFCPRGSSTARAQSSGKGYFTLSGATKPQPCGIGFYCPNDANREEDRKACSNAPEHAHYSAETDSSATCTFDCDKDYQLSSGICKGDSPEAKPVASIRGQPSGESGLLAFTVTVSGERVAKFRQKVIEGESSQCQTLGDYSAATDVASGASLNVSALRDGIVTICVLAETADGLSQDPASPTSAQWTKDTTAPTAVLSNVPVGTSGAESLAVTVGGDGVVAYRFKLGIETSTNCAASSGYGSETMTSHPISGSLSSFPDGMLKLCVIAKDSVNNWQSMALGNVTTATWTKLANAPSATLSGQPIGRSNAASVSVTVAGNNIVSYQYKIVDSATQCASSNNYSAERSVSQPITGSIGLADGTVVLCAVGKNNINIWQPYASYTAVSWTKDTTPPAALIAGQPTGTNSAASLSVTVSGTDVTTYRYKLGPTSTTFCSSSTGYSNPATSVSTVITDGLSFADGDIILCVIGIDSVGNQQSYASATSATWTKLTSGPVATITGAPFGENTASTLNVDVGGAGVISYKYKLTLGSVSQCTSGAGYSSELLESAHITASLGADGAWVLCVIGKNSAGNWQSTASATATQWTRDTTPPVVVLSNAPTGRSRFSSLNVDVLTTNGLAAYRYKLGTATTTSCSDDAGYLPNTSSEFPESQNITASLSSIADGSIRLCVKGRDGLSNWTTGAQATLAEWVQDTTGPDAPFSVTATAGSSAVELAWQPSPSGDATGYMVVRRAGGPVTWSPASGTSYSISSPDGNIHQILYVGTDRAYSDLGLTSGTTYQYKVFAFDDLLNYGLGRPASATPQSAGNLSPGYRYYRLVLYSIEGVDFSSGQANGWTALKVIGFRWNNAWQAGFFTEPTGNIGGVPTTMTSSSVNAPFEAWKAATAGATNYYLSAKNKFSSTSPFDYEPSVGPTFVQLDFGAGSQIQITGTRLLGWNGVLIGPDVTGLLGSNDGLSWQEIIGSRSTSSTNSSANLPLEFVWSWQNTTNEGSPGYRFYKLEVNSLTASSDTSGQIADLRFYVDGRLQQNEFTRNTDPSGTSGRIQSTLIAGLHTLVSESSVLNNDFQSYGAWRAFDPVTQTNWVSSTDRFSSTHPFNAVNAMSPEFIKVDLGAGQTARVTGYHITCPSTGNCPDGLVLKGSNDGSAWTTITGSSVSNAAYSGNVLDRQWNWSN